MRTSAPSRDELVERPPLGRAGVGRREDAQRPARPRSGGEGVEQRSDAAAADERHDDVDRVGRLDLRAQLVPQARLARRVGEQRRVEQRDERLVDRRPAMPSGRRRRTAWRTVAGSTGTTDGSIGDELAKRSSSARATSMPTSARWTRLRRPARARSVCSRCHAIRSGASAARNRAGRLPGAG